MKFAITLIITIGYLHIVTSKCNYGKNARLIKKCVDIGEAGDIFDIVTLMSERSARWTQIIDGELLLKYAEGAIEFPELKNN